MTSPFDDYIAAQKEVNAGYKRMDEAVEGFVRDAQAWNMAWASIFRDKLVLFPIPGRFLITDESGNKIDINISARATLIERALPTKEE